MNFISTKEAPAAIGPYSQAVEVEGLLYTSGQIALTPSGEFLDEDIKVQTKQVLKNIDAVLKASNRNKTNVFKTTIFLASMDDFTIVNEIYAEYFGSHKPIRSTVAVKTLPKNALVEIDLIAK